MLLSYILLIIFTTYYYLPDIFLSMQFLFDIGIRFVLFEEDINILNISPAVFIFGFKNIWHGKIIQFDVWYNCLLPYDCVRKHDIRQRSWIFFFCKGYLGNCNITHVSYRIHWKISVLYFGQMLHLFNFASRCCCCGRAKQKDFVGPFQPFPTIDMREHAVHGETWCSGRLLDLGCSHS